MSGGVFTEVLQLNISKMNNSSVKVEDEQYGLLGRKLKISWKNLLYSVIIVAVLLNLKGWNIEASESIGDQEGYFLAELNRSEKSPDQMQIEVGGTGASILFIGKYENSNSHKNQWNGNVIANNASMLVEKEDSNLKSGSKKSDDDYRKQLEHVNEISDSYVDNFQVHISSDNDGELGLYDKILEDNDLNINATPVEWLDSIKYQDNFLSMSSMYNAESFVQPLEVKDVDLKQMKNILDSNSFLLVLFYAPWCYWSRVTIPEFQAAANILAHHIPQVESVKINGNDHNDATSEYGIIEYPTIVLFIDSKSHYYTGKLKRASIINWVDEILNRDKTISSERHLDMLMTNYDDNHNILIGAFNKEFDRTAFTHAAWHSDDRTLFAGIVDVDVIKYFIEKYVAPHGLSNKITARNVPFLLLYDHHDKNVEIYTDSLHDINQLDNFVGKHKFPSIINFNSEWATQLFLDGRPILFVVCDSGAENLNKNDEFKKIADEYRGQILFVSSGNNETYEKRLINLLGIEDNQLPSIRIVISNPNLQGYRDALKYKPTPLMDGFLDIPSIKAFIESYLAGKLDPYLKTEPIPEEDGGVDIVANWNQILKYWLIL